MPRLRPAPKEEEEPKKVAAAEAEPEVIVEEAPEIEVEIAEPEEKAPQSEQPKQDDATIALKKQIESMRESYRLELERVARDRDEALQLARDREAKYVRAQKEAHDSQASEINAGLMAAKAELAKARLDIENAINLGDARGQAEALERQAIAINNLAKYEDGKAEAEERAKEPLSAPEVDPIDTWNLPKITTDWLKNRRHWLTDAERFEDLKGYQWQAKKSGLTPHTQEFLDFIEDRMNGKPEPEAEVEEKAEEKPRKAAPVSAPVSREIPNASGKRPTGKVKLTPAEVDAARISGITPEEYAAQKLRKEQMIASGEYGEQR